MSSIDPSNARLVKVEGPRSSDDEYEGLEGAPGAEKWHGNAGVYYDERRERVTSEGGSNIQIRRLLEVSSDLPVVWAIGDVVTFRAAPWSEPVAGVVRLVEETPAQPGEPGEIALELELE